MNKYSVSSTKNALIIFIDIIDSSVYSSILGLEKYAEKVLEFQQLFEDLGNLYFCDRPDFKEKINAWCRIAARGDEGHVFLVDPNQKGSDLVYKSIKFVYELKARLKILNLKEIDKPPQELKIAAGIHYGEVSLITKNIVEKGIFRNFIDKIIGHTINYAKRVEESSRIGNFSQIILSKQAIDLLYKSPIVFYKHITQLKGIHSNENVFEVLSAFLEDIPLIKEKEVGNTNYEEILNYCEKYINKSESNKEAWLNSFIISVLKTRYEHVKGNTLKQKYFTKMSKLAWRNPIENDPILLYFRARECEDNKKYTRALSYYKSIIEKYPSFIYARVKMVETCYNILKSSDKIPSEMIFVRDTAEELLEKFEYILSEKEKIKIKEIIEEVNK